MHYQDQLLRNQQTTRKKKAETLYDQAFTFQLSKAVKLDDETKELEVNNEYIASIERAEFWANMPFDISYEEHKPIPKARGFGRSSLYLQLLFLIYRNEFPNSSLPAVITKALDTLVIFEQELPSDFSTFIEHMDFKTKRVYEMKHLTKRVRAYIILMRHMGNYFLDKDQGHERPLLEAYYKFHEILPTLYRQMSEQDEMEPAPAPVPPQNPPQQLIVAPKSDHFLTQPFTSFKALSNDTWFAIPRKISEIFLWNPFTNNLGKALAIPDYDYARQLMPALEAELTPQH